jgi:hypothetical protein
MEDHLFVIPIDDGVDVMITIFGGFVNFRRKKIYNFAKNQYHDQIFAKN